MSMSVITRRGLVALLPLALAMGCGSGGTKTCSRDQDCPQGQICAGVPPAASGTCQAGQRQDGGPGQDGGPSLDGGGGLDGGGQDGGGQDGGAPPIVGTPETETVSQRSNDTQDTAQAVNLGDTYSGTIGNFSTTDGPDQDYYKFTAQAGDVLKVTVSARTGADYEAFAAVVDASTYQRVALGTTAAPGTATRQFFIPTSGDYYLLVLDRRTAVQSPPAIGGPNVAYMFKIEKVTNVTTRAITLPHSNQDAAIDAEGSIIKFTFTTSAAGQGILASTKAAQLTTPSDVDTMLYVVDATAATPAILGYNDDISAQNTDSQVRAASPHAGAHYVILDFYSINGDSRACQISVESYDATAESEPNDPRTSANPLPGIGVTVTGAIHKVDTSNVQQGDLDYFKFEATAGKYYLVTVTPTGGNPLAPAIVFIDPSGAVTFANPNKGFTATAKLEAYTFEAGTHYVRVGDAHNGSAAPFVGGTNFTYQLQVTEIQRQVKALSGFPVVTANTQAGAINDSGRTIWYTFEVPAGTAKSVWIDLDLSQTSGADGLSLNPFLILYGTDGKTPLAGGNVFLIRDVALEPGVYTLTVWDNDGKFAADGQGYTFRPRVVPAANITMVSDTGGHNTAQTALAATPLPSVVAGNLTAGGQNWYSLGALSTTDKVRLSTTAGPAGAEVDTYVWLYKSDNTTLEIAKNDDISPFDYFSFLESTIPSAGTYLVKVNGGTTTAAGPYRLFIQLNQCGADQKPVALGDLYLNEIFTKPVNPGGDANGDGVIDAKDQFVEMVNFAREAKGLSGIVLRDAAGIRYRGACGLTLGAGQPLVVFGGCNATDGGASCANLAVANTNPNDLAATSIADGLALPAANGTVMVVGSAGQLIDRVTYAAGTDNVSFVRGTTNVAVVTCDARPVAATTIQNHTACTDPASAANFTPGKRANNTDFPVPPAPAGETCQVAVLVTPGTLTDQTLGGYLSDYRGNAATCMKYGSNGPDKVYSITVPTAQAQRKLTVTVTPTDSTFDPGLYLIGAAATGDPWAACIPVPTTCLAGYDEGGDGDADTVTWTNTTGADKLVYIVVDTFYSTGSTYSLTVALGAP